MFLRREKIVKPKSRPKMQIRIPQSNNVWPLIPPRNFTMERSGNFRLASPPASCAEAAAAESSTAVPPAVNLENRFKLPELQWDQAFCSQVRMYASSKNKLMNEFPRAPGAPRYCTPITVNRLRARHLLSDD